MIAPKAYQDDAVKNALEIFRYAENQLQQVDDSDDCMDAGGRIAS